MKGIKYIVLLVMLLSTTSCEKFLEKNPHDFLYDTNKLYATEKGLESAMAAVYDRLGALHGTSWLYSLGLEADEGYFARDGYAGAQHFDFPTSDSGVLFVWRTLYEGIERANVFLENLDTNPNISESFRNRLRGEALFLRGYYYFILVQSYGGVPLRTTSTGDATDNMEKPRNTVAEVYAQILEDMEAAEKLVPEITEIGHGGRVSKSAARGLLARVCLTMAGYPLKDESKYKVALDWALKVKNSGIHSLNPDFTDVFVKYARDEYDIKESIWEVEYWGNKTDIYTETGYVGYVGQPQNSNTNTGNGFAGVKATPYYYRKFNDFDIRRDWTIANFTYGNTGPNGFKTVLTTISDANIYNRAVGKWRREFEKLTPKTNGATPQNFPLLRYSDILLMIAEAENAIHDKPTELAYDCINQVRRRAYGTGFRLKTFTRSAAGSGYTNSPVPWIVIKNTEGHEGARALVHINMTSGGLGTTLTYSNYGAFYSSTAPEVEVISFDGKGSGAKVTATVEPIDPTVANLPNNLDKSDFLKELQDERSRELGFEQMRKFDLIRWGIFFTVMNEVYNQAISIPPSTLANVITNRFYNARLEKNLLWPIPATEMLVNRNMVQNPGW
ncbi:RagB/SusD domain protein [Pseudopedobacter saltans DSM 12145]|uniref:RagB/SusD domain protein n=1 Tax=Pseudopedobacter saltans (strain ATCC 51119 / DSM 12145 / JCM 21818 / CCUG 39354 / LMG 10337 / NBRC 100064 / NCIMB 13643) TaxID=762903 RepID=F0S837_PSESL|nr:RagB/SusD family nutrient uptake outer membrane protein [Pseudopedobacter saltans]ADY51258.1 RagB/SusD domain protein [Pseudopedobacter saltans DSM 12145]